ncbi:hypothetical protein [Mesorhizobium sp.]
MSEAMTTSNHEVSELGSRRAKADLQLSRRRGRLQRCGSISAPATKI